MKKREAGITGAPSSDSSLGQGKSAKREIRMGEEATEKSVSKVIREMPFLWLNIDDSPHPGSVRVFIDKNAISLLSKFQKPAMDPPTADWLGHFCNRERVRASGLWNQNHVDEEYDPSFMKSLEILVDKAGETV